MREEKENKKFYVQKVSLSNIRSPHCEQNWDGTLRESESEWMNFGWQKKHIEVNQISSDFTYFERRTEQQSTVTFLAFVCALSVYFALVYYLSLQMAIFFLFQQRREKRRKQMKTYNKAFI